MAIPIIAAPLLAIAAAACPRPPPVKVLVMAGIGPLSVETDYRLDQLRALARQAHSGGAHPPYGAYVDAAAYAIRVAIGNDAQDACRGPLDIEVTLKLADRHIEVAQELKNDPCQFDKVEAHYRHHADADKAIFERYVGRVAAALSHTQAAFFVAGVGSGSATADIARATQSVIESVLAPMDADRAAARAAVDTPAEVSRLEKVCADAPPAAP